MATSTTPATHLKATYTNFHSTSTSDSPLATRPFEISTPLQPLSASNDHPTTEQKIAYLRSLRAAVSDLQSRVNSELTARMEDEASRLGSGTTAGKKGGKGVDEVAEEENYGEEVVEDDE